MTQQPMFGWTCANCGVYVSGNQLHTCPTRPSTTAPAPTAIYQYVLTRAEVDELFRLLRRTNDLLERIAGIAR